MNFWTQIKNWSGWSTAGTIFLARMEILIGFVLAVLASLDWTSLLALAANGEAPSPQTIYTTAIILTAKGIITEIVRRWNATDLDKRPDA